MLVNGKKIAGEIYADIKVSLAASQKHPCLTVFTCAPNAETRKYMELKKKRASELGIDVLVMELDSLISTEKAVEAVRSSGKAADGVIVQLPFPTQVDADALLAAIPKELDVDNVNYAGEATEVLSPVVGAIYEIAKRHDVEFSGKNVVVIGRGRLVGKPAALWAKAQSADVTVIDKNTPDADSIMREADIIISGAGSAGLITSNKIKDGVVIFDAGASEEGGELLGDADPACASKCSLFTPVPGGIGPVTIAILLRNLVDLSKVPH